MKYNISAYRVLFILRLMTQDRDWTLLDIGHCLMSNHLIPSTSSYETLVKYIHTLRRIGCDIPSTRMQKTRVGHKGYRLLKNPFTATLHANELTTARDLLSFLATQPDKTLHNDYECLLEKITSAIQALPQEGDLLKEDLLLECEQERERVAYYQKLCTDAQMLRINYKPTGSSELIVVEVQPHGVVQEQAGACLLVMKPHQVQQFKLRLDEIERIEQLHQKIDRRFRELYVTFRLSGRLARTYRLYPGETVVSQPSEEPPMVLTVRAQVTDYQATIHRLIRYGEHCEVLSPDYVRKSMQAKINAMLEEFAWEASFPEEAPARATETTKTLVATP